MMQIQLVSDAQGTGCNEVGHCGVTIRNRAQIELPLIKELSRSSKLATAPSTTFSCRETPLLPSNTRPINPRDPQKANRCRSTRPVGTRPLAPALRPARMSLAKMSSRQMSQPTVAETNCKNVSSSKILQIIHPPAICPENHCSRSLSQEYSEPLLLSASRPCLASVASSPCRHACVRVGTL